MKGLVINNIVFRRIALAGFVLAGSAGLTAASSAQAATPAPVRQMKQAALAADSYRAVTVITRTGPGRLDQRERVETVVVHRGEALLAYFVDQVTVAGQPTRSIEVVHTGTHVCLRPGRQGEWQCQPEQATAPTDFFRELFTATYADTPVGSAVIQGQPSEGYQLSDAGKGYQERGTLWISRATNLPVERESVTTTSLIGQSAPSVNRATTTWSHWNDAALQIPSVPAA